MNKLKSAANIIIATGILILISACGHEHSWIDATCTEPKTCSKCGETEGEPLGHEWVEATCDNPKTCSVCGQTEGEALGHTPGDWEIIEEESDSKSGRRVRKCTICGKQIEEEEFETRGDIELAYKAYRAGLKLVSSMDRYMDDPEANSLYDDYFPLSFEFGSCKTEYYKSEPGLTISLELEAFDSHASEWAKLASKYPETNSKSKLKEKRDTAADCLDKFVAFVNLAQPPIIHNTDTEYLFENAGENLFQLVHSKNPGIKPRRLSDSTDTDEIFQLPFSEGNKDCYITFHNDDNRRLQYFIITTPIDATLGTAIAPCNLFIQEIDNTWGEPDYIWYLKNNGFYERHGIIIKDLSFGKDEENREMLITTQKYYNEYYDTENNNDHEADTFEQLSAEQIVSSWDFSYLQMKNSNNEVTEYETSQLTERGAFQPTFRALEDGTFSLTIFDAADEITGKWVALSEEECSKKESVTYAYELETDYFAGVTHMLITMPSSTVDSNGEASQMLLSIWSDGNTTMDLLFKKRREIQ